MRILWLAGLLLAVSSVTAEEVDQGRLLAAARLADETYQRQVDELRLQLADGDAGRRVAAVHAVGRMLDQSLAPYLLPFLESSTRSPAELQAACVSLAHLGFTPAAQQMRPLLQHPDEQVRLAALNAMGRLGNANMADFKGQMRREDDGLRVHSSASLGTIPASEAVDVLVKGLQGDRRNLVRQQCAIALGRLGDKTQGPALVTALSDPDLVVRRYAAEALVKLDHKPAIPYLLRALEPNLGAAPLNRCLKMLSGQDFGFDPNANVVQRMDAIERGDQWWALHAKELAP